MKPWPPVIGWPIFLVFIWIVYGSVDAAAPRIVVLKMIECEEMFRTAPDSKYYKACMKEVEDMAEEFIMQAAHLKNQPAVDWIREIAVYDNSACRYKLAFGSRDASGSVERFIFLPSKYQPLDLADINRKPIPDEDDHDATFLKMKKRIRFGNDERTSEHGKTGIGVPNSSKATIAKGISAQERILPNQDHTLIDPEDQQLRNAPNFKNDAERIEFNNGMKDFAGKTSSFSKQKEANRLRSRRKYTASPEDKILPNQESFGPENNQGDLGIQNGKGQLSHAEAISTGKPNTDEKSPENIDFGDRLAKMRSRLTFNEEPNVEDPNKLAEMNIRSTPSKETPKGKVDSRDEMLNRKQNHFRDNFEPIQGVSNPRKSKDTKMSPEDNILPNQESGGDEYNRGKMENKKDRSAYSSVTSSTRQSGNAGPDNTELGDKAGEIKSRFKVEEEPNIRSPIRPLLQHTRSGASKRYSMGRVDSEDRKPGNYLPSQSSVDFLSSRNEGNDGPNLGTTSSQTDPKIESYRTNPIREFSQDEGGKTNIRSNAHTQVNQVDHKKNAPEESSETSDEETVNQQSKTQQSVSQGTDGPQKKPHWLLSNRRPSEPTRKPEKQKRLSLGKKFSSWMKRTCTVHRSKKKNKNKIQEDYVS